MLRSTRVALPLAVLLTFFVIAVAQEPPNQDARFVRVGVLDQQGAAIADLTKENFRIHLNGRPATLLDAHYSSAPLRLVVLIDVSGSMGPSRERNTKWQITQDAVRDLLDLLPPEVPVAMTAFAGKTTDTLDFSKGRPVIKAWLEAASPDAAFYKGWSEGSRLFDSISLSLKLLEPFQQGDALYVITDGRGRAGTKQTRADLLHSGVRMFSLLFSEDHAGGVVPRGASEFTDLVTETGGSLFSFPGTNLDAASAISAANLDAASAISAAARAPDPREASDNPEFDRSRWVYEYNDQTRDKVKSYTRTLNTMVCQFYLLQVALTERRPETKIKIEIVDHAAKPRRDVKLSYPGVLLSDH